MSEVPAETPAPAEPTVPELDVTQPAPPPEAPPLPAEPAEPEPEAVAPAPDTAVLVELLAELRDLKAKIVAAIGG